ncbi:cupin domain-containing protein [Oscillibacter sp. MSJ-2]|uniref:Cupin domain-containing protein n=1 Tax=Dysosmobacter acutus TaxID=2841504 RepID=A0ABS6F850_9FIRM|nr:cupin domain-containing protein [Dysosmobacter acutus]MBU5626233.1 cupin domain-containing protein [Dysosmobacter acutus]
MLNAEEIVKSLNLEPLEQEGGMYRVTYTCEKTVDGEPIGGAIYYFLTERSFSHFHKLTGDEVYHFYLGDPVELVELLPDGKQRVIQLGTDLEKGQTPQHLVRAGSWQGSHLLPGGKFALLGTTMSPGFTPGCYEHGVKERLMREYPAAKVWIERLTGEAVAF